MLKTTMTTETYNSEGKGVSVTNYSRARQMQMQLAKEQPHRKENYASQLQNQSSS